MPRVKRSRFDIIVYTARGSRLQWTTQKNRMLSLTEIADALRKIVGNLDQIAAADTEPGAAVDVAVRLHRDP